VTADGTTQGSKGRDDRSLVFRIGPEELVVRRRYELLSITNDIMIGVWFAVGSILFFSASTVRAGTWLFLIGSTQLLVRPLIRLRRNVRLRRISQVPGSELMGSGHDF